MKSKLRSVSNEGSRLGVKYRLRLECRLQTEDRGLIVNTSTYHINDKMISKSACGNKKYTPYQNTLKIPYGRNRWRTFVYIQKLVLYLKREQSWVDERDLSHMVQGPTFLSLPARSGADWYLKLQLTV